MKNREEPSLASKDPQQCSRKVACLFCHDTFSSREAFRSHVQRHTGEKPYTCNHCDRKFTLKQSLVRHSKKHDPIVVNVNSDSEMESQQTTTIVQDKVILSKHQLTPNSTSPMQLRKKPMSSPASAASITPAAVSPVVITAPATPTTVAAAATTTTTNGNHGGANSNVRKKKASLMDTIAKLSFAKKQCKDNN